MTIDKLMKEIEEKTPWVHRFLNDYAQGTATQEFARSQITSAYGKISEEAYLETLHIYNGITAARGDDYGSKA